MLCEWYADGSGNQSNYNQHFQSNMLYEIHHDDDSSILTTSLLTLQLYQISDLN